MLAHCVNNCHIRRIFAFSQRKEIEILSAQHQQDLKDIPAILAKTQTDRPQSVLTRKLKI